MNMEAWHFVRLDGTTNYLQEIEVSGKTYSIEGPLELCKNGLHGSIKALDALNYGSGPLCRRTLHTGEVLEGTNKLCSTERTILWQFDATQVLHLFAVEVAEDALLRYGGKWGEEVDPRSWEALRIKRAWLRGEATDQELSDARVAAWAAAYDASAAARDASDAAYDVRATASAASATASAASAARAASDAAYDVRATASAASAAWAAANATWVAMNDKLGVMLEEGRP